MTLTETLPDTAQSAGPRAAEPEHAVEVGCAPRRPARCGWLLRGRVASAVFA